VIIAIHGFLGLPSDWLPFDGAFKEKSGNAHTIRKWDLYSDIPQNPPALEEHPLRMWAKNFCERIERGSKKFGVGEERTKPILMGYSMGGRLALHALLENEKLFSGAIIISAHPGLTAADLKLQRKLNDAKWAERFRTENWNSLIKAWGEQEVFSAAKEKSDSIPLERQEADYDRVKLARAMQVWSLANQQNLRPYLASVSTPTLWISGSNDRRYRELFSELRMDLIDSPAHDFKEVSQAGHRVPWDNPGGYCEACQDFLNNIQ
jgi:2-succinyl-6-hydroxy-2,4-cyclohexadiene-1-carboxylate synthase